ncbi:hypothetical protein U9M48_013797, partial [Paspalum notatum var. saurae]
ERNSALDQSPVQKFHSILKISDTANVLEIIDCLGVWNCFDKKRDVDSSSKVVISLVSANTFTTLQSFSSDVVFLQTLNCLCAFLFLNNHLQLNDAFLHGVAEVKQDERLSKLFLHFFLCRVWRLTWLLGVHIISSMLS